MSIGEASLAKQTTIRWERVRWALVAAIAVVGLLQVAGPFTGDQALFTVFARQLNQGDALYTDLWDVKQPGLFWWYAAAGAVGGYDEIGIHLFEIAWLVSFAAWMPRLLQGELSSRRAEILAPALSIGMFLLVAEAVDFTQAEVIGGPVVFLGAWCGATASPEDRRRLLLAGLLIGAAAAIKLTLAPLAAVALLVPICSGPGGQSRRRRLLLVGLWSGLGFATVAAAVCVYLAATGSLGEALDTWFRFAPSTTATSGRPASRLVSTVGRTAAMYAPLILLAAAGATRLRSRTRSGGRRRLILAMAAWLALVPPLFLVQHWWPYLLQITAIPLGVLAAEGVDVVSSWCGRRTGRRWLAIGVLAAAALVSLLFAAPKWSTLASHGFGVAAEDREALHAELAPAYGRGDALRSGVTTSGTAFVLGDPIVLLQSGRDLGIPTNGWSPEQLDTERWEQVAEELLQDQPAVVVIDDASRAVLVERAPATLEVIEAGWCQVGGVDGDQWYVSRDLIACDD